jgi:GMP synthase-like glutamine amidotransferase
MADVLGGEVANTGRAEYGKTDLDIPGSVLFQACRRARRCG